MWLLENAGNAFQGRRLWLRPGKRYLFGRTRAEPGQLVISDKTISRKHLTIEVDRVRDGDGRDCDSRSVVTVEDLGTKIGTVVNGTQIRGQKFVLLQDRSEIKMGHMADLFRITWRPVVFSLSFSSKELQGGGGDPWAPLRRDLEPLDVKYLAEYDIARTTHAVAKKRNTPRGLQALINGKYIVTESFLAAVVQAATPAAPGGNSPLEDDFDGSWPDALAHLPPRGDEPSDRPVSTYGPDPRRRDLFEGYTFVFYDPKQYENLLVPVTNGKGKALLGTVVPGETEVDDFVRYVKGVAGEKGLGEFEDGSAGRGVVVVRYVPAKGDHVAWFTRFTTAVALRLDHRLIDQREFLDAILAVEPGMLRRPLEVEETAAAAADDDDAPPRPPPPSAVMDLDQAADEAFTQRPPPPGSLSQASSSRRARARRGVTASRFKGFDEDLDSDKGGDAFDDGAMPQPSQGAHSDDNMFVSQTRASEEPDAEPQTTARNTRRKRGAVVAEEDHDDDVMDDIAPTAAAVKRRRIEAGVEPVPPRGTPDVDEEDDDDEGAAAGAKGKGRAVAIKKEREDDILDRARRNREAAEKRAAEERERLAELPDDGLDAEAIRRLTLVETMAVRAPPPKTKTPGSRGARDRDQDVADGRWDPQWNGRRNFKKFRRQGDVAGRPPQRVIVGLEPAKTKEYGLGDGYWLEGGEGPQHHGSASASASVPVASTAGTESSSRGRAAAAAHADDASLLVDDNASVASGVLTSSRRRAGIPATNSTGVSSGAVRNSAGGSSRGESVDSGLVNLEILDIVPDTEPEDGDEADGASSTRDHPPAAEPAPDLPRTRAGKAGARTAAARQSQATTQARGTASTRTLRGQSPLFATPSDATQGSAATAATGTRGSKRAAPAQSAANRMASPAKRPRRGAGAGTTAASGSAAAAIAIRDSDSDDEDDGLKFKFRSRR